MKKLTVIGLAISAVWLAAFVVILILLRDSLHKLELNEWGDFLAGVTAPLALIWIVIGYFLQGDELKLNTEALKSQQEELRRQVAETAVLAANSDRQAKAAEQLALLTKDDSERAAMKARTEAQPIFRSIGGINRGGAQFRAKVRNAGATVSSLSISTDEPGVSLTLNPVAVFEEDSEGWIKCAGAARFPFDFRISYADQFKELYTKNFKMTAPAKFQEA